MKNSILILMLTTLLSCCTKNGETTFSGSDQLPAETQIGANTVGCLVNGKVFLPKAEGINPEVNCFYQLVDGEYYFTMAFSDLRGTGSKTVNIFTSKITLEVGIIYILEKPDNPNIKGAGGEYRLSQSNQYNTNSTQIGELKITKLDPTSAIISGTFWFDAVNSSGEKVEIREGRFDWKY